MTRLTTSTAAMRALNPDLTGLTTSMAASEDSPAV
jgi:hypothetical protein